MKHLIKIIPILCWLATAHAGIFQPIREFTLDDRQVYTIPVSGYGVTTISFPGPISAIEAAGVTVDGKTPGLFQLAHTRGSYFFSVRALVKKAAANVNVRWNNKTYVLELVESNKPMYSVNFNYTPDAEMPPTQVAVTPDRLLGLLDTAKAFPLLYQYHPEAVADVDYTNYEKAPKLLDCTNYQVRIDEVFRFNSEDTLVFHVILRNKTNKTLQYQPNGFSLRVGERLYPQSISDASGIMPPKSDTPAYFAVTGTPNGGRNDISIKNDFTVLLDASPVEASKP